jgi:FkbM family methyltransferase
MFSHFRESRPMPLIIRTPRNPDVIADSGPYPHALNMLDRKRTAVQRQLRRGGLAGYEPVTQAALLALMQGAPRGAAFFDVGAHIGLYAALVRTVYRGSDVAVYAFEPTPVTAELSRRLCRRNRLDFEIVETALAAEPGAATLYASGAEATNSLEPGGPSTEKIEIETTSLDAFTASRGIDPMVVKIDVSAGEGAVLAGARVTVARSRPAIVCEIRTEACAAAIEEEVAWLLERGYTPYPLIDALPWPRWHPRDLDVLPADQRCRNWLFLPAPLSAELTGRAERWLAAIAECDARTNVLVPTGERLPPGWNKSHPHWRWPLPRTR